MHSTLCFKTFLSLTSVATSYQNAAPRYYSLAPRKCYMKASSAYNLKPEAEILRLLMFTKMLRNIGNLPLEKSADHIAEMGFDGADLTVRPGGYVLPEEAALKLPEAITTLKSKGLTVPMITTSITGPEEKHAEEVFKTASKCDVEYIKLGYWRYEGFGRLKGQIEKAREELDGIYALSKKHDVTATVHTHAGAFLSADPALVFLLLKDYDPQWLGAYIDPGHMFAEIGPSGWEMGIDLLAPYIKLMAVKNYRWLRVVDEKTGEKRWRIRMAPLKEEIVPWPNVFECLRKIGFDGCVSLHSEYEDLDLGELIQQTREDLDYVKNVLKNI